MNKKAPATYSNIEAFLNEIDFKFPQDLIDFYMETNGAEIMTDKDYIIIWPLTDLLELNHDYNADEYASEFFFFGSDGGDTAYTIQKVNGHIFEMPFIGMSNEEAIFKNNSFAELLTDLLK